MTGGTARRGFDWEAAGHEFGESLGAYHAIVVIGVNPVTTGRVAIGIGRAQAAIRRVAVGDLFAESPPIQELVQTDDPHGLVDSFLYGVSLSRIASVVPDAGQLYVMPSGTEPPQYEEILTDPRWERLAAGFREVNALLVLAVPASAPHVEDITAATDGAVLVGDAVPPQLPVALVIGSVREFHPVAAPSPAISPDSAVASTAGIPGVEDAAGSPWPRGRVAAVIGIVVTLLLAAVAAWLAYRPLAGGDRPWARVPDCAQQARAGHPCAPPRPANVVGITPDSSRSDTTPQTARDSAPPLPSVPAITNAADSASAAAYSVELIAHNTQAGAIMQVQTDWKSLPSVTFSPTIIQNARWFKVLSGAFPAASTADSLRTALIRQKTRVGPVVRLPFAFLLDSVAPTAASSMIAAYVQRGQPVYALRQTNGSVWLLVGAFESAEQAALYVQSLPSGVRPVLVYRKGRAF